MPEINQHDRAIILDLAKRVRFAAETEENKALIKLWQDNNDLLPTRPAVYADAQNGWDEFNRAFVSPFMRCEDSYARQIEFSLRFRLSRREYIHDDCPVNKQVAIGVGIQKTDWGIGQKMTRTGNSGSLSAYHIEPTINSMDDVKRLKPAEFSFDEASIELCEQKKREYEELFEGNIDVTLQGIVHWRCGLTRQLIHMRGLDNMMYDLYDDPELIHALMAFLRDEHMRELDFWEKNKLISPSNRPDGISGTGGMIMSHSMKTEDQFTRTATYADFIGWGESQEFVGVGPEQFREFVYEYQVPILRRFGRVDFGCCEPLDNKYNVIFSKLDNIRAVAVAPWADFKLAAEKLGNKYIYVFKQNPAYVCCEKPDFNVVDDDLRKVVRIAMKKNCPMQIVLKDTNSFFGQAQRLTEWSDTAVKISKEESGME